MNRSVFALVLAVLLVGSVLVVSGAGAGTESDETPSDATTFVEIDLVGSSEENPGTSMRLIWSVRYDAPSAEAARRAENGTLDVSWFQGDEAVRAIASDYPRSEVDIGDIDTHHYTTSGPHGGIRVTTTLDIDDLFANDREQIVIGPTMADYLSSGDFVELDRPDHWEPVEANVISTGGRGREVHRWTIGEDPEPRIVLNQSAAEEPDSPLGTGPIVAVVALALVTVALAVRRRER